MKRLIVITVLLTGLAWSVYAAEPYQVVVNSKNPITSISRATIRSYYMGKATRWPDGSAVKPIDLSETSDVREGFSKAVLGKDVPSVKSYWLTMVFAGRGTPPVQFESDDKVLATVRSTPGAIGYVSAGASPGSGAKAIAVTD